MVPPKELEATIFNLETKLKKKLAKMDLRIKNLKPKKKKKAEKKTFDERMAMLSEEQQNMLNLGMKYRDANVYEDIPCFCCPGYTRLEAISFWPPLFTDEKTKE